MKLICPHCDYSRTIDPQQIPEGTVQVKCPLCLKTFDLPQPQPESHVGRQAADAEQPQAYREPAPERAQRQRPQEPQPRTDTGAQRVGPMDAVPKAGFWIRVVATLVDAVVVFCIQFVLGSILALAGTVTTVGSEPGAGETAFLVTFFSYAVSFAYYIFFTGYCGQTPGKMALRIKVVRCDGSPIGYGRAAFREVPAKFISGIIFGFGYLMVAFDEQKRGLHDRMTDTYVIKL